MKLIAVAIVLSLTSVSKAHEIFSPETQLYFILKTSRHYIPGSKGDFDSKIDYERVQQFNFQLTKDKVHEILNSIDADKVQINKIEEPPHKFVVEIKEPRQIRFYFDRRQSKRPSPHTPQYHEEWDYFLIGIKEVQPEH